MLLFRHPAPHITGGPSAAILIRPAWALAFLAFRVVVRAASAGFAHRPAAGPWWGWRGLALAPAWPPGPVAGSRSWGLSPGCSSWSSPWALSLLAIGAGRLAGWSRACALVLLAFFIASPCHLIALCYTLVVGAAGGLAPPPGRLPGAWPPWGSPCPLLSPIVSSPSRPAFPGAAWRALTPPPIPFGSGAPSVTVSVLRRPACSGPCRTWPRPRP